MPEYLVRLVQIHESFRKAELESLAELYAIDFQIISYSENSPFAIVSLPNAEAAQRLLGRSILSQSVWELYAQAESYTDLHTSIKCLPESTWTKYGAFSFRFSFDSFRGSKSTTEQREIIESFSYLPLFGPIRVRDPELNIGIFEDYDLHAPRPKKLYMGRFIAGSGRQAITKYDLKKRHYISTTSMDAELALVTANMALAAPGRLLYDPFVGTGGFPISCAHFGAMVFGSDIDGRSIRGKGQRNVKSNFRQYNLESFYLDGFVSDLTNSPIRGCMGGEGEKGGWLHGIVCDPPYGIREGLKVLGSKDTSNGCKKAEHMDKYKEEGYIPPKRPYSFEAMLDDILHFAAIMLVERGRLSMWMPTANDEDIELAIPTHPWLEIVSVCVQPFNKWSRRLLTYRRLPDAEIKDTMASRSKREYGKGSHADDLNNFRKRYFEGFKDPKGNFQTPLAETLRAGSESGKVPTRAAINGQKPSVEQSNIS